MPALSRPATDSLPLTRALWVDEVCLRFEDSWKAEPDTGRRPSLDEFLAGVGEPERSVLAGELIRLDVCYRRQKGEAPCCEDYEHLFADGPPDWLPEAVAPPEEEGFFPGYELLEEVGRGGMGVVYKVWQPDAERFAALKTIRAGRHAAPVEVERFCDEVKSVADLEHPNIVPIYHVGEHRGQRYFTMRWFEGGSLSRHVSAFAADHRAAARLLATVARAVHYAHQRGIIHRDLKPANILLEGRPGTPVVEWVPVVADLGLAARVTADEPAPAPPPATGETVQGNTGLTKSRHPLGTASYMPPEAAAGEKLRSTAIDVYGLGAVLYELLTGRPPFQAATVTETLEQVKTQPPQPPHGLVARVDRELEAVCLKCLEKEPEKRYPSALAVAEDLERWLCGEVVDAYPVAWPRRLGKWAKRRPAPAALLLTLVLLAGFGVGTVVWEITVTRRLLHVAESTTYVHSVHLADRDVQDGRLDRAEESLENCPPHLREWEWHYLKRVCHRWPVALGHTGRVLSVEYSADGRLLATGDWGGVARVWDAATFRLLHELPGHAGAVNSACFSSDGRVLITAGEDQTVRFWDTVTGGARKTEAQAGSQVTASRRNNLVASVGRAKVITLWDVARGKKLWELPPLDQEVTCLALSHDGRYLAATGYNQLLKVWETDGRPREVLPRFVPDRPSAFRNAFAVAFSPDGKSLVAGGEVLQVWDIKGRASRLLFGTGGLRCSRVTFSPDGKRLAATYRDGLLRVWDVATGKILLATNRIGRELDANLGVDFSPDGEHLALTLAREVTVLSLKHPEACRTFCGPGPGRVCALAFSAGGRLASRAGDGTVVLWDLASGQPDRTLMSTGAVAEEATLVFTRDGRWLLSGCERGRLQVWDAETGRAGAADVPAQNVRCCAVSHNGKWLVTADAKNVVQLWDLGTGQPLRTIGPVTSTVRSLAFRPGDRQLASCGSDGVILWDTATGKKVRLYRGQTMSVACIAFSPDGRQMASASDDSTVRLWDVDRGEALFTLRRHDGPVACVAFSPNGKRLASASHDGTVRLWDTGVGEVVLTLRGHDGPVTGVAFSPDGLCLATCSHDGSVRVWDGSPLPADAP